MCGELERAHPLTQSSVHAFCEDGDIGRGIYEIVQSLSNTEEWLHD